MERNDERRIKLEQAIGRFILDLGMIETTMVHALAALIGISHAHAHFLLNKTAGGAKAQLLKDAAEAKGIDLKATGLAKAIGTIQEIMSFRNRLTHDAIAFMDKPQKWVLGQGTADNKDEKLFGKRLELDPEMLAVKNREAWAAMTVIGLQVLVPHGGFKYSPDP